MAKSSKSNIFKIVLCNIYCFQWTALKKNTSMYGDMVTRAGEHINRLVGGVHCVFKRNAKLSVVYIN